MSDLPHTGEPPLAKIGPLHKLYHWMIWHAKGPHAQAFLFAIAFAESSIFPLPPDILLMAMVLAHRQNWLRYFMICLAGSVLGGMAGYAIGFGVWEAVGPWFLAHVFPEEVFNRARDLYARYDFWVVFTAAFTPIPYKVFTIAAGVTQINFVHFALASIIGRGGRFILVAYLLHQFGAPIRAFIEKYLNLLTVIFTILLIGCFYLLKYLGH
jgi:membrane protein YqaA with SNARE-associated domain